MRSVITAVVLTILATSASAQDTTGVGAISGVVVNAPGLRTEGVRVCALDTASCATSDAQGVFRIGDLRAATTSSSRGGSPLENLFIVDNVGIPSINAFANFASAGGTVSLLDAELLQDVTFLTGGYPAPFINRTSSVLQVTQREGSRKKFGGWATLGFAGAGSRFSRAGRSRPTTRRCPRPSGAACTTSPASTPSVRPITAASTFAWTAPSPWAGNRSTCSSACRA